MTKATLELVKQKMKDYRDLFGGELSKSNLINDAENIFDLDYIFEKHFDYISDMANNAQNSLDKFKRELGVF